MKKKQKKVIYVNKLSIEKQRILKKEFKKCMLLVTALMIDSFLGGICFYSIVMNLL